MQVQHQRFRHEHRPRTGDEPSHARSPLRMRLAMAIFGLADGLAGIGIFGFWLRTLPFLILSALLTAVALVNVVVVAVRMHQGPHFQPGRDVPPYRPVESEPQPRPWRPRASPHRRRVRYLSIMGTCLVLIVLAWFWVRYYSVFAAGVMTAIAALLPPVAAVVANADSPVLRGEGDRDEAERERPGPGDGGPSRD